MESSREYKYDNLKFILIFFVVFAHFLELFSGEYKRIVYLLIYTFHMPTFVYISGYFSRGSKKSIINYIYIYFVWQTIYFFIDRFVLKLNLTLDYGYPNWVLWYIFALIIWSIIIGLLKKVKPSYCKLCIVCAFIISILSGFIESIGYKFSLSRIITFLPYFLIGYFNKNHDLHFFALRNKEKVNIKKVSFYLIIGLVAIVYLVSIGNVEIFWLYGSYSYFDAGYDFIFKMMWICLSLFEICLLNNVVTNSKIKMISSIGRNTLLIYLIHGIFLKVIKVYSVYVFGYNEVFNMFISVIFTILILILLGNKFIKEKLVYLVDVNKIISMGKK